MHFFDELVSTIRRINNSQTLNQNRNGNALKDLYRNNHGIGLYMYLPKKARIN